MEHLPFEGAKCGYCHGAFEKEDFSAEWGDREEQHYASVQCGDCGKKSWVDLEFEGSGHASLELEECELESMVSKVVEG